jgi:6,7-dimethyl-8-ribityllumazine synthase
MLRTSILIVEARFYAELADQMLLGAMQVLEAGNATCKRVQVPGSFELPAAIRFAIDAGVRHNPSHRYDGYVALGCVVEGETDHYEHICREASRGLMDLSVTHAIPLGFGLLTCRTYAQAAERAAVSGKNKGADAARACLQMVALKRSLLLGA